MLKLMLGMWLVYYGLIFITNALCETTNNFIGNGVLLGWVLTLAAFLFQIAGLFGAAMAVGEGYAFLLYAVGNIAGWLVVIKTYRLCQRTYNMHFVEDAYTPPWYALMS